MSLVTKAIKIGWPYLVACILLSLVLGLYASTFIITIPDELQRATLGPKLTFISIISAAAAFYYKLFWDDIERSDAFDKIAGYYSRPMGFLLSSSFLGFASLLLDFVDIAGITSYRKISFGLFGSALILLAALMVLIFVRALGQMQTLKQVAQPSMKVPKDITGAKKLLTELKLMHEEKLQQTKDQQAQIEKELEVVQKLLKQLESGG